MRTTTLREQLQQDGTQSLSNEELLTLILCTESTTERVQMIRQIHKLFAACGDLHGVICAEFGEICLAHGFGEHKTAQLQSILELAKRLATRPPEKKYRIRSIYDAVAFVRMEMMYLDHEQIRVLVLNTKNEVIANLCLYEGTVNSSVLRVAEVFRPAITRKAPRILLCHNHPSGDPLPSPEDLETTKQVVEAGQVLEIELLDHVIIGNPGYISIREQLHW